MPRRRPKPKDWALVAEALEEYDGQMEEAEAAEFEGNRRHESMWGVMRVHREKSRYIYERYYRKRDISKECYEYCLEHKIIDRNLISKWKKQGFERLCCLGCIQPRNHNFRTTCICRVPKEELKEEQVVECIACGCRGCASGD